MTGSDRPPYPVQVDLEGRHVQAFDWLGLPVYRKGRQVRDFEPGGPDA